jgi:AraC family transcriptional regulator
VISYQSTTEGAFARQLETPRLENGKPLLIAGLRGYFTSANWDEIPEQWQRLGFYGNIRGKVGRAHYGLCYQEPNGIDYLSGVEVSGVAGLLGELSHASIPAQKYAVFPHREHVSKLPDTVRAIKREWLPASGLQPAPARGGAPDFFERYGESFDPRTGYGDVEVWIPIKS